MQTLKSKFIKNGALVKFSGDDTEYKIVSINQTTRKVWAERTGSLRRVQKPMSEIIKLDRKPVEIKD